MGGGGGMGWLTDPLGMATGGKVRGLSGVLAKELGIIDGDTYNKGESTKENEVKAANAKAIADAKLAVESQAAQAQASITDKKRAIARSRSVYTSPLGLGDQATTARKTLLGQ